MEITLKTNNDLKYLIKKYGSIGLREAVSKDYIYCFNEKFYFTQSKYKVETNLLIKSIKILFKNKHYLEATKLLALETYYVKKVKDVLKYSYQAYEYYFIGMTLKDLNIKSETFTQIIKMPTDLETKVKMLDEDDKKEVINLFIRFLDKIILLFELNIPLSIYILSDYDALNNEIVNKKIKQIKLNIQNNKRI